MLEYHIYIYIHTNILINFKILLDLYIYISAFVKNIYIMIYIYTFSMQIFLSKYFLKYLYSCIFVFCHCLTSFFCSIRIFFYVLIYIPNGGTRVRPACLFLVLVAQLLV